MPPYTPPAILFNRHLETIYPSLLRNVSFQPPVTERVPTPDDDFLDIDWYRQGSSKCIIISHGLEGNSSRSYVLGMAKAFFTKGYDVMAWNYRGCGHEMNHQLRFYHSGETDDLHRVVSHAAKQHDELVLIGFSLGGNITLKYLGEGKVHGSVKKAVAFSVPMDLHMSCLEIGKPGNWIYSVRFLRSLKKKVREKAAIRKELKIANLDRIKTLIEFDNVFTGPLHGFRDAIDYYTKSSSLHFIPAIVIPTLIVNALNDPFLSPSCYPQERFKGNKKVHFEFPERGGHVGFTRFGENGLYWSEMRALLFIESD